MRRIVTAFAIVLLATLPGAAREQVFTPNADGQIEFVMPSGNVGCIYTPKGGTDIYMPAGAGRN